MFYMQVQVDSWCSEGIQIDMMKTEYVKLNYAY